MPNIETGIPGYSPADLPIYEELAGTEGWTPKEWKADFFKSQQRLISFINARDPYHILARSAARLLTEGVANNAEFRRLEQSEVEILQALLLYSDAPVKMVPTSPSNFCRFWPVLSRNLHGFMNKEEETDENAPQAIISRRARLQTLYYRNLFNRTDCNRIVKDILKKIDHQSDVALGYKLSALFSATSRIIELIEQRMNIFMEQLSILIHSNDREAIHKSIEFFSSCYDLASRAWRHKSYQLIETKALRASAFQMSELSYPWIFTISRHILEKEFDPSVVKALYSLSFEKGELASTELEHIYLNNPIWQRPYIQLDSGDLFAPLPQLPFSFPFTVIERLINAHDKLKNAYADAKSACLENEIAEVVATAMPNAVIHRGVEWDDPETGKTWENDVVAQLGNFLFVFEAKSGRINEIARRGGRLSLERNFKELFIEPGLQGWRLQKYIDDLNASATFRLKRDGSCVDLKLDKPKVIFRFSVCFEHFAGLTSAKHHLKELGLIKNDTAWAPVLSLGELLMIARFLDAEPTFQHYLTRRATLEDVFDFEGDEQDILSMYITNGLCFDASVLEGRRLHFFEADSSVRSPKTSGSKRDVFESLGVHLSPLWKTICKELYTNKDFRHRFDIINTILNQHPPTLMEIERCVRKYRRGVPHKGADLMIVRVPLGSRTFALACYLAPEMPEPLEWQEAGRNIAKTVLADNDTVDCATFIFARRMSKISFDGVSFYRLGQRKKGNTG